MTRIKQQHIFSSLFELVRRGCVGVSLVIGLAFASSAPADSDIVVRLSFKVLRSPVDGGPPNNYSDAELAVAVADMNALLQSYGRGYRFEYDGLAIPIGNIGGFARPNPSHYFDLEFHADPAERANFLSDGANNPNAYAYDNAAINIFIGNRINDQQCYIPSGPTLSIARRTIAESSFLLHQVGHFFELCNTQGCTCNCCSDVAVLCSQTPGDDGISDTLPDLPCWTNHDISQNAFGVFYHEGTPAQREAVDDVFGNIMSFHSILCGQSIPGVTLTTSRMTEKQLDRWADAASTTRIGVCDGRTFFVQAGAGGFQNGRSTNPFDRVVEGVTAANSGGDIVIIRGGTYVEPIRISTPVTLRTPRGQTARIGG